ncbi:MAG: sulfotransferase [Alphaproteobacteria bacterium]
MVAVDAAIARLQRHCRSAAKIGRRYIAPASDTERTVIFVAGQQRSGTNMLMDMLDRHWRTDVFHETDSRAFDQFQMRDLPTIQALVRRSLASHVVIKALCESHRLKALLDAFPGSRAIWLVRHYHDVSDSMAKQFSTTALALKQMRSDPALGGWRGEGMSASVQALLEECVADDITEVSAAAFQWLMRNQLYFDQAFDRDQRVKLVFYEDLVACPQATLEAAMVSVGLDYRRSLTAHVFASSVRKSGKPPIDPRIDALCQQLFDRLTIAAQTRP